MKKLLIFLLLLCTVITVSANPSQVVDHADLLTQREAQFMERRLESIQAYFGIDVVIQTENSLGGKAISSFADDAYDYGGYGKDGVLLLLDMETRNWYISTSGSCMSIIDADTLSEYFVPYLSAGEYNKAFTVFTKLIQVTVENPQDILGYSVDKYGNVEALYPQHHWYDGLWQCLLIGVVIGGIAVTVMAVRMKSVRPKGSAADYVREGSMQLTVRQDLYLYQRVSRRARPKNNGGTHRSSSGRSHGGGGGKF